MEGDWAFESSRKVFDFGPWELYKSGELEELQQYLSKWLSILEIYITIFAPIMPKSAELMQELLQGEKEGIIVFPR